jgi:hypothetical protein
MNEWIVEVVLLSSKASDTYFLYQTIYLILCPRSIELAVSICP